MLISYDRPKDLVCSLIGSGAAWLSDDAGAALTDGRPANVSRIQWLSGDQTTASELILRATWGTALVPRVLGLIGLTLPVGTLIKLALRRPADAGYTYQVDTYSQRVVQLPDGSRCAWFVLPAALDAVIGTGFQILNDVNGSATIAAGSAFDVGELWVGPAVEIPHEKDWTRAFNDASRKSRSKGGQLYTVQQRGWRTLQATFAYAAMEAVRQGGLANGMDWETLEAALAGGAPCVGVTRFDSAAEIQRTAIFGTATLAGMRHLSGPLYSGGIQFEEVPASGRQ